MNQVISPALKTSSTRNLIDPIARVLVARAITCTRTILPDPNDKSLAESLNEALAFNSQAILEILEARVHTSGLCATFPRQV